MALHGGLSSHLPQPFALCSDCCRRLLKDCLNVEGAPANARSANLPVYLVANLVKSITTL
jgi:hypothetical protein